VVRTTQRLAIGRHKSDAVTLINDMTLDGPSRYLVRFCLECKKRKRKSVFFHKLHHTAFRETLAAEVAALSILEYDGLPWPFYLDMARQVEDESRHALLAFQALEGKGGHLGQYKSLGFVI
jgi:hypothetical protein